MLNPKLKIFTFLILWLCHLTLFGQTNTSDTGFIRHATDVLQKQSASEPIEKVYLHLDKPYYMAGDNIWFKAYLTSGGLHQLSSISGVLNVELLSEGAQKPLQAIKLPVAYGITFGDFRLPATLPAGHYYLRAYTNYMRNFDADYIFNRQILIGSQTGNNQPKIVTSNVKTSNNPAIQFFPESGSLVNGINSKMAFKAVGASGMGKWVNGIVTDNTGAEITRFASQHSGMGSFNLYPVAGKTYKALLTFADSSHQTVNLPVAANAGYTLTINNLQANNFISVRVSYHGDEGAHHTGDSTVTLIAQSGGYLCYAAKVSLHGSITIGRIPKDKFPTGIAQITLFASNGEPLCERVCFVNNHDQLNVELTDSSRINTVKKTTRINLQAKDATGKPVIGSFSASVIDNDIVQDDKLQNRNNIQSYLLLSSDLKGNIEAPGYYFNNENDTTLAALDLLMLTQGYRHFEWKKALANAIPAGDFLPETGLIISGRLTTPDNKPLTGGHVTLFNKNSGFFLDTISDKEGRFAFHNLMYTDTMRFSLRAKADKGHDIQISVDKANVPLIASDSTGNAKVVNIPAAYEQAAKQLLAQGNNGDILLKEVKVNAVGTHNLRGASPYSTNLNGAGNADQIITSQQLENMGGDLTTILPGMIAGVRVNKGALISARSGSRGSMLIILDGSNFNSSLSDINPSDIASIEVLKSAANTAIYGFRAGSGVVVITTKHGGDEGSAKSVNAAVVTVPGFYKSRVFYSPDYDNPKGHIITSRSTIYWKPDIVTDKDGNAFIRYFNDVSKGTYRVIVEGISLEGKIGSQVFTYKVE